jgi:hypothetical protein
MCHCEVRSNLFRTIRVLYGVYPLLAAGGPVTFVATKVTKKAFSRNASLPHKAFAPQSGQNQGLQLFAQLRSLKPPTSAKLAMPLQPHKAIIVLPPFTRSCSADGKKHILKSCHPERSEGFVLRLE